MKLFSERYGYVPRRALQVDSIDDGLRNRLWNVVKRHLADMHDNKDTIDRFHELLHTIWDSYFKNSMDEFPMQSPDEVIWNEVWEPDSFFIPSEPVKHEFFSCSWHKLFDLLEFIVHRHPTIEVSGTENEERVSQLPTSTRLSNEINRVMEEEQSGYRLIGNTFSRITEEEEIRELENALDSLSPVAAHIQRALELLSDREQPDYRNSIKEAISAVESIANLLIEEQGKSLGDALPKLEEQLGIELHGALRKALGSLYGWTSNEGGIRHALLKESDLTQEDARLMLIVCSAFVNYLKTKAAKSGSVRKSMV